MPGAAHGQGSLRIQVPGEVPFNREPEIEEPPTSGEAEPEDVAAIEEPAAIRIAAETPPPIESR